MLKRITILSGLVLISASAFAWKHHIYNETGDTIKVKSLGNQETWTTVQPFELDVETPNVPGLTWGFEVDGPNGNFRNYFGGNQATWQEIHISSQVETSQTAQATSDKFRNQWLQEFSKQPGLVASAEQLAAEKKISYDAALGQLQAEYLDQKLKAYIAAHPEVGPSTQYYIRYFNQNPVRMDRIKE